MTLATRLYASYRTWAREQDPEGPLGYTAFLNVVDRGAPVEGRVRLMKNGAILGWRFRESPSAPAAAAAEMRVLRCQSVARIAGGPSTE